MLPAANLCGHIWIKKLRKVLKSQKTLDFQNPGFSGSETQNFKIFCLTFERFDCIILMVLLVYRSNRFCLGVQKYFYLSGAVISDFRTIFDSCIVIYTLVRGTLS
jgi:hypothetical protein